MTRSAFNGRSLNRCAIVACLALWTGACATAPSSLAAAAARDDDQRYLTCVRLFRQVDQAVRDAGVRDVQAARIRGYPYLRVNRFLASYRDRPMTRPMRKAWIDRLQALGERGRAVELANLPAARREALARAAPGGLPLDESVRQCGRHMRLMDMGRPEGPDTLRRRLRVPGDYRGIWRALGLYPLTAVFFAFGVDQLHRDTLATFSRSLGSLPVRGALVRYVPPDAQALTSEQVAGILTHSEKNPLHIPTPDAAEQARLFAAFAPVWEVDVAGPDDRMGTPEWATGPVPRVDTERPRVYRLLSHTWWQGHALLQLNYVIWFPARPAGGALDPYAGHIDGVDLRVTLGPDGHPLIYDSIHNCGCYQMFFPSRRLRAKAPGRRAGGEPPLVPQFAPVIDSGQRLVVRVAHRTHYLQRLYADETGSGPVYRFADYNALRTLPTPDGGHRGLFDEQGYVPGTERAERWWLWPMGVPNPGGMRQWGHHATAFVGERYFDDPHLLEGLFLPVPLHELLR